MKLGLVFSALVLAAIPSTVLAKSDQKTQAQQAVEAEASLREMADEVFVKAWEKDSAEFVKAGISATSARKWGLWMAVGYSLGFCRDFASATAVADWNSSFDRLGFSKLSPQGREEMRESGLKAYSEGVKDEAADPADSDYCGPELIAVGNIVRGL